MPDDDVQRLLDRMDTGFGQVHNKIEGLKDEFVKHQLGCMQHFNALEFGVKENRRRHDDNTATQKEKRDVWKYFIRTVSASITIATLALLGKMLLTGARIVIQG